MAENAKWIEADDRLWTTGGERKGWNNAKYNGDN